MNNPLTHEPAQAREAADAPPTVIDPRDAYAGIDRVFREGWDEPLMAAYDRYEEHRG